MIVYFGDNVNLMD